MFTPAEKELLQKYVTSAEDNVFAVRGMEGMVGAAYARYSRAKGGFREVLLREFIKEGIIDLRHADELIERILIAYGDDSVGELEGAHISFENISMVATKEIEDRRIGGSPIEQSTRYVFYDQKMEDGSWRYLKRPELTAASFGRKYLETMDFIFETYASLIEPMKNYFSAGAPIENAAYDINGDGQKETHRDLSDEKDLKAFRQTYNADLRTKACDSLRALLPLSTLTNVGIFGNGRFFQNVISHLLTCGLPEAEDLAGKTSAAASQVIPQYVRRAKKSEYAVSVRNNMKELAKKLFSAEGTEIPAELPFVNLLDPLDYETSFVVSALFPFTGCSVAEIRSKVSKFNEAQRKEVLDAYIGNRQTRRDRPGRALEDGYPLTFEMVTNWGVYKDLMRHRMNSQQRQLFTAKISFDLPPHLKKAGFEEKALECAARSRELFDIIEKESPLLAQYAVLHGNFVRWTIGMNAREAIHLIELRTTPQGHSQYRAVGQMMHREIKKKHPALADTMKFVDYNSYESARGDSEARQRVKEKVLEKKLRASKT